MAGRAGRLRMKSELLTLIALMVAFIVPVLDTVTDCAAVVEPTVSLPKLKAEGPTETWGVATVPVPDKPMLFGELVVLLEMESQPLAELAADGLKIMLTLKLCDGDTLRGSAGAETTKAELSAATELTLSVAVPVFVTVMVCAALEDPTETEPKPREVGASDAQGAVVAAELMMTPRPQVETTLTNAHRTADFQNLVNVISTLRKICELPGAGT